MREPGSIYYGSERLTPLDVSLLNEGDRVLKCCLSSSQAKREKMVHWRILDHSDLSNGDQERKSHSETDRYHLREEMRRHPRGEGTVRSPVSWKVSGRREYAHILKQLMDLPMKI